MKKNYILLIMVLCCLFSVTQKTYGQQGTHLNFDGIDDYVTLETSLNATLDNSNAITVEAWVKPTSNGGLGVIAGNYNTGGGNVLQFLLRRDYNTYSFWVETAVGRTELVAPANSVLLNTWQHVVGVWNSTDQTIKIYINGVLKGTKGGVLGTSLRTVASSPIFIGNNNINEDFKGDIDELRIWDHALTETEISNQMNSELPSPTTQVGLLAYYQFNQGVDSDNNAGITTLIDSSVGANNGTLSNFALTGATSNWISTPPAVTSVNVPANATYGVGGNLDFTINFDENVTVTTTGGTPYLSITVGSTTRQATYTSGSGTSALVFRYTVQASELDTDGIAIGTLVVNGSTVRNIRSTYANLTLNNVGVTTAVLIDPIAPMVTSVTVPANATYVAGQNLTFTVNFNKNVIVNTAGGIPQMSIAIGASTRQAVYQSGSGSVALLFRYTVQAGESDSDGIAVGTLSANSGTIRDLADNNAVVTLNSVGITTAILVDAVTPTVLTKNITVQLDATGNVVLDVDAIDNGSSDAFGVSSLELDKTSLTCLEIGENTVVLKVTDNSGNFATQTAKVTVEDKIAPILASVAEINVNTGLDACGAVVNYTLPIATDNCSQIIPENLVVNGSFENNYDNWTIISSNSLFGILNLGQTVTTGSTIYDFSDNKNESIASPGFNYTAAPKDGNKLAIFLQTSSANHRMYQDLTLPNLSKLSLSFDLQYRNMSTSFDANNQYFSVVIKDPNTDLVLAEIYKTVQGVDPSELPMTTKTFDISSFKGQAIRLEMISSNIQNAHLDVLLDNISIKNLQLKQTAGLSPGSIFPIGKTTNSFLATDASGNTATTSFDVIVTDNQLPVIVSNGDQNVIAAGNTCGATVVVSATATDNCTVGTPTGVRSDALALDAVYPVGTTTIKWNVSDANGNAAAEVIQTVVVTDNQIPVIVSNGDLNVNTDVNVCGATVVVSATATDNCTVGAPTGVRSDALPLDAVYPVGTTTITWNVADANSNDAVEVIQTVVVTDNQIPVIVSNGDKNVNTDLDVCEATVVVSATATDNCTVGTLTGVRSDGLALDAIYPVGTTTIKWNVSDANNNAAVEVIQTVVVTDNQLPTVITKNITVQLDASSNITIAAADINNGSTDNCGISLLELDGATFSCANVGDNTVTLKVTDNNGNVSTKTAIVTVVNSQPNLIRKHFDDVIFFDNSSNAFIGYSWYKNGLLVSGQTAQYFKDSGVLNGTYYAMATKVDGTVVTTCPLTFSPSVEVEYIKIMPNPVRSNSVYQLVTNVDSAKLKNARVTVFSILGAIVTDQEISGNTVDLVAPSADGIYIVRMTLASGKYFTKNLLVKN